MQKTPNLIFYNLSQYPELVYGLSLREHGSMKLSGSAGERAHAKEHRYRFFLELNIVSDQIISADLVHGTGIAQVSALDGDTIIPETDGLLTADPNLYLTVTVADCFPVYMFDPKNKVIGLVHAGWRGILARIVPEAIHKMEQTWNTKPQDLVVAIGPGIQQCHFAFPIGALSVFKEYETHVGRNEKDEVAVDLPTIIARQAQELGVENIETCGICTFCNPSLYYSFRRDKPASVQAMVAYMGRK
jgi:polyphenol oxidase